MGSDDRSQHAAAPADEGAASPSLADLTRRFTHDFMNGDGEKNVGMLADDFAFIAATPGQTSYDRDCYLELCGAVAQDDVRIVLTNQSFVALPLSAEYGCVLATFRVFLSKGSAPASLRGVSARLVFHWSLAGREPRLMALESAFVLGLADVYGMNARDDEPLDSRAPEGVQDDRLLEFRDDHRISHFVAAEGILYVEAHGHKCTIHCVEDVFDVNEGISAIAERLGEGFVRLHRSYLVNPWHLRTLSEKGAMLDDGETLPVPSRRLEELREVLRQVKRPRTDLDGIGYLLWSGKL